MYVPRHFEMSDRSQVLDFMREHSFALLVSSGPGGLTGTHIPLLLEQREGDAWIVGHLARANSHWHAFDGEQEAMAVFSGPHAYISPSWHGDGAAVPTWDYVAVHAYGRPVVIDDDARVMSLLGETVGRYESGRAQPWSLDTQDAEYVRKLTRGIVAFELRIERIDAKAKLGQNRIADQPGVVAALQQSPHHAEREMAELIARSVQRA